MAAYSSETLLTTYQTVRSLAALHLVRLRVFEFTKTAARLHVCLVVTMAGAN